METTESKGTDLQSVHADTVSKPKMEYLRASGADCPDCPDLECGYLLLSLAYYRDDIAGDLNSPNNAICKAW